MNFLPRIITCFRIITCLTFILSFTCSAYAYNLSDVKKDYPKLKIKTTKGVNDYGNNYVLSYADILVLKASSAGTNKLTFTLVEKDGFPSHVLVTHYYSDLRDYSSWMYWNRITIGTGTSSVDVYPVSTPSYWTTNLSLFEQIDYQIREYSDFDKWKNAILIRAKGQQYYCDFKINQQKYKAVMDTIERFLFSY